MLYKLKKVFLLLLCFSIVGLILYNLVLRVPKIIDDISNFDKDNIDELKVIDANYFSSYKDVFVIKLPINNNAFSFGIIFLGNDINDRNTVRHEYGHYLQLEELGIYKYSKYIVIPSLYGYWSNVPYDKYYSQPWEYGADLYGNVNRDRYKYDEDVLDNYNNYWNKVIDNH